MEEMDYGAMVHDLETGLKYCHSMIQQNLEKHAKKVFAENVQPTMVKLVWKSDELTDDLKEKVRSLKYGSYADLAGYLDGRGLKKAAR